MNPTFEGSSDNAGEAEPTDAHRWWLQLQIALGLSGGAVWFVGAALEQDFLAGVGCGLIAAALILRLGRRAAVEASEPPSEL